MGYTKAQQIIQRKYKVITNLNLQSKKIYDYGNITANGISGRITILGYFANLMDEKDPQELRNKMDWFNGEMQLLLPKKKGHNNG